jgi:small subunit ribosomal protein S4
MSRYLGPKVRLSRRVGVPIADIPKHTGKELTIPGMHGYRGRRNTEYGVRLAEKQKLRFHYNILERQFRKFLHAAQRSKGNTADAMLSMLESRLDNVCRRLGLARTIWGARQLVVHGHVLINGKKLDRPSYQVQVGEVITVKAKVEKLVRENMESMPGLTSPAWIEWNPAKLEAKIIAPPKKDDVPFEVNMNLIIELYQ